jgi:5-methyltetrahydropteroyltriglutamate--homocysteine methyltransferase
MPSEESMTAPPFRADHVGSLLRPPALRAARARRAAGEIADAQLAKTEDAEIEKIVRRQESIGLRVATDGEFRRYSWNTDFLANLDGAETVEVPLPLPDGRIATYRAPRIAGKVGFTHHPMIGHFAFLAGIAKATPKLSIPSPSMMISLLRDWRVSVSEAAYPDRDAFCRDLAAAYKAAVGAFAASGCRYLQLDDCNLAYLCDPAHCEKIRARGDDPKAMLDLFIAMTNAAIAGRPAGMVVSTHICRGNFRSTWLAQGGYEPVAEAMFNRMDVDAFFLEYDSERAGGFEPLRFVPKGKQIVLGLVTTKAEAREPKDLLKRRIDQAAKYVDIGQLCLSPQCGFASTEEGNIVAEDAQWAKLALVVETAREVWGEA